MEAAVYRTTWHQVNALVLENEILKTVVVPEMGAKLVSLMDKRNQREWLVGPDQRPFQPVSYGASFVDQDMSGWDEMFPTIVACEHHGADLPDHGEVWTLPWSVEPSGEDQITLTVEGKALPYCLTRTLSYSEPDVLHLHYRLVNTGQESMPYIWAAHPQFDCGESAQILLPSHISRVCNTIPAEWGWGTPETAFGWPEAVDPNGDSFRLDQVGPSTLNRARKFFCLPDDRIDWVALIRQPSLDWLRMAWSSREVHYFGLWVDEGALNHTSVATPEPTTGFYDSLSIAREKSQVTIAEPGETCSWTLTVQLGTGDVPLKGCS